MTPEEMFVGSLIMYPDHYFDAGVSDRDFTSPRCRSVFAAIGRLLGENRRVDLASVASVCDVDIGWLATLTSDVSVNVDLLAERVKEDGKKHRLRLLLREAMERIEEPSVVLAEYVESGIRDAMEDNDDETRLASEDVAEMVEEFERRYKARGKLPGISTGLLEVDESILGFEPQRLYIVGARPSEGKSALLLNFAIHAAHDMPVGFLSIESSRRELLERAFSNLGGIDVYALKKGLFKPTHFNDMTHAAERIGAGKLWIADRPNMSLAEVQSRCRRLVRQHGVRIVFIDYIQLIQLQGNLTDYERVSRVSVALKALARELEIPIVAAAQLNRQAEGQDRKPRLSDFKNSGQIEQDADAAILIWVRNKGKPNEEYWLCIEKNRDGATRDIQVLFMGNKMQFRSIARGV